MTVPPARRYTCGLCGRKKTHEQMYAYSTVTRTHFCRRCALKALTKKAGT